MRKFLVLTFVALFAMVGVVSAADTAQTSAALKIGVVDMQTLAQDSDPAKAGRAELEKSIADYENEHKNDKRYVEYNKMFAEREKALQDEGKKGKKKKKISADNLLR